MKLNRILAGVLAAVLMLLPLSGCGEKEDQPALQRGSVENGTYTNTFANLGLTPGDEWTFLGENELLAMNGIVSEAVTDEEISEALANNRAVYDMFAQTEDGRSINVVYEKMSLTQTWRYNEATYLDASQTELQSALESMGLKEVETERGAVELAGRVCQSLKIEALREGEPFYEELIAIQVKNYMISITLGSIGEDRLEDMAAMFFAVKD